ncbi:MAG: hypothetical protein R6V67_12680 [Spirochaetia bacterium]
MKETLHDGHWYRLTLKMGRTFTAEYIIEKREKQEEYFVFPDQSRTPAGDLIPFLSSIEEIEKPEEDAHYDITDFLV